MGYGLFVEFDGYARGGRTPVVVLESKELAVKVRELLDSADYVRSRIPGEYCIVKHAGGPLRVKLPSKPGYDCYRRFRVREWPSKRAHASVEAALESLNRKIMAHLRNPGIGEVA
jgi:hypothetical protein